MKCSSFAWFLSVYFLKTWWKFLYFFHSDFLKYSSREKRTQHKNAISKNLRHPEILVSTMLHDLVFKIMRHFYQKLTEIWCFQHSLLKLRIKRLVKPIFRIQRVKNLFFLKKKPKKIANFCVYWWLWARFVLYRVGFAGPCFETFEASGRSKTFCAIWLCLVLSNRSHRS